jgi:FAD/FMN-containing dehydrogenase/Fe-S oxidoreductase
VAHRDTDPIEPKVEPGAVSACLRALADRLPGRVRADEYNRMLYATDASIYRETPLAVVIPRHTDDVQAVMETAAEYGVPVLPRTAGSSLAGQAVNRAIVVDFTTHLDGIVEVDAEKQTATVEPGVVLDTLNRHVASAGLQFGPDPASSNRAAMGGIVSNNSTGSHSIAYGMTADHVQAMDVVLSDGSRAHLTELDAAAFARKGQADGREGAIYRAVGQVLTDGADTIRRDIPRHWRRCGGYNLDRLAPDGIAFHATQPAGLNLASLVCGAEGTLAIIERVTVGLVPRPEHTMLGIAHFRTLEEGLAAVEVILETNPTAVELLDHLGMSMCRLQPMWRRKLEQFVEGDPACVLITEYAGASETEVRAGVDGLAPYLKQRGVPVTGVVPVPTAAGQRDVWNVRKMGLGFLMSVRGDHKPIPFIEDAAVPVRHLSAYVTGIEQFCRGLGFDVAYYAHASAGCIHIRPMVNTKAAEEIAKLPEIMHFAVEQLRGYGGALSSEHGDGRARSPFNEAFFGPELYGLFRRVKQAFDPDGLMNPGIVVNAAPMTTSLRYGADYRANVPARTHLDWSRDQGYDQAVEMCNGAGVCRKLDVGAMCPSFMATREEEHSTRGRANALRAVMSGALPPGRVTDERLYETMDLCLQCKACVSECPSSVDMATLKVEFLAGYHEKYGVPRRSRMFADAAKQARRFSGRLAGMANRLGKARPLRALMEKTVGIAAERSLPPFAAEPFTAWFGKHRGGVLGAGSAGGDGAPRDRVVLFNDTFNTYHYPEVAIAATKVLEAAGYDVILPGHGCCGRPAISKGLVEEARQMAGETIDRLAPLAQEGLTIVGLEPSCVLSFDDEYAALLPGDPRVALVAEKTLLFDDFIARCVDEGRLPALSGGDILLHGHCHQKAAVGTAGTHKALGALKGCSVTEVDAGCCGMAGSFGFEREHYDLSMAIGGKRLFPAVNATPESTTIVAPGVSCRQQIAHGTGRRAWHPAEVLAEALARVAAENASEEARP